jgi:DNA-directed RNA polymerase alpha subunit
MNNISIKCLKSEKIQSGACYGQFVINSLQPGQGITIGNQLRRVILEILLNLKGVVLKSKTKNVNLVD